MSYSNQRENKLNHVIDFRVDDEILVDRITGRRVHPASGRTYHIKYNPPKEEGIDDVSGEPLIHRVDDNEEVFRKRLESYNHLTYPLLEYYNQRNIVTTVDASQNMDTVLKEVEELVGGSDII
jgi:adenylate kinase